MRTAAWADASLEKSPRLLLMIAMAIAVADGITRAPNADWESMPFDTPLHYVPYKAAFLFAGLLLPLTLRYARRVRASLIQGLLLWLVMCTAAYSKDFAYIHLPGASLFVTDVVLAVLFFFVLLWPPLRLPTDFWPIRAVAIFVALGILEACRGIIAGREVLMVFRDFAVPLYAIFLLIGMYAVDSWPSIQRLCRFFVYGAIAASLAATAWFVVVPAQRRYIFHGGPHVVAAFVATLAWIQGRKVPLKIRFGVIALLAAGIVFTNSRTAYVSLGICFIVFLFTSRLGNRKAGVARPMLWLTSAAAVFGVLLLVLTANDKGSAFVRETSNELVSGTINYENDANAEFRFQAWNEAMARFSSNPLFGEGFGVPFVFDKEDYDSRPHNTYLTVLYKMGLVGFIPLVLLLAHFFAQARRVLRACSDQKESLLLYCCMLAFLSMCISGLLNLALESPFTASIFWLTMGVGYRMMILLAHEHRVPARTSIPMQSAVPA